MFRDNEGVFQEDPQGKKTEYPISKLIITMEIEF
jgi:hypothetical protein